MNIPCVTYRTIRDFHILVECLLYIDDDFENEVTCHVWVSRSLDLTHFFNLLIMYREIGRTHLEKRLYVVDTTISVIVGAVVGVTVW
jgi:hypothetical protein